MDERWDDLERKHAEVEEGIKKLEMELKELSYN